MKQEKNEKITIQQDIGKNSLRFVENKLEELDQKIDINFKYTNGEIENIKDKIVYEVSDVLKKFLKINCNSIKNVGNEILEESKERQKHIERLNNLTDYDKIILKNLESRISILEEETQDYTNLSKR